MVVSFGRLPSAASAVAVSALGRTQARLTQVVHDRLAEGGAPIGVLAGLQASIDQLNAAVRECDCMLERRSTPA